MSVKERIGGSMNTGSLEWDEETTRAVDVITALGVAQVRSSGQGFEARGSVRRPEALGSCLWRLKYAGDTTPENYRQVLEGVCRRVHTGRDGRPRRDGRQLGWVLRAVVAIAVEEWRVETCTACRGRKFVGGIFDGTDTRAKVCMACSGFGIIQRSSDDRADAVARLLRATEAERIHSRRRVLTAGASAFIVTPRVEHVPNLRDGWDDKWGAKYQAAIDVVLELDGSLARRVRRKLGGREE